MQFTNLYSWMRSSGLTVTVFRVGCIKLSSITVQTISGQHMMTEKSWAQNRALGHHIRNLLG